MIGMPFYHVLVYEHVPVVLSNGLLCYQGAKSESSEKMRKARQVEFTEEISIIHLQNIQP